MSKSILTIWTIGHSTRTLQELHQLLLGQGIEALVDVRSFPGSRRYPQFNRDQLSIALTSKGIDYHHLPSLGGRRTPKADSPNTAWQNASFRAYADHMASAEFEQGINDLLALAGQKPTVIMCAEAVWWSCHRSLIADHLKSIGVKVIHILDGKRIEEHPYTTAARLVDGELSYRGLLP
ncbi:MAG TPA: DUF488 domain-containing protein [Pyrinomonadaceae bacterium]|nr:DUF488 domain-containing protein [Pyrinomonadaceae bacterium]